MVPALERASVESLASKAAKVGPDMVAEIEGQARWNPAAKASLVATAPQCIADALNSAGIGADKAHWAALVATAGAIAAAHFMIAARLDRMTGKAPKTPVGASTPVSAPVTLPAQSIPVPGQPPNAPLPTYGL